LPRGAVRSMLLRNQERSPIRPPLRHRADHHRPITTDQSRPTGR